MRWVLETVFQCWHYRVGGRGGGDESLLVVADYIRESRLYQRFLNQQTFLDIFIDISHILYYNIYSYLISRCKKNFTPVPLRVSPNQGPANASQ